ncbi:MAG: hypothetical protein HOW73_44035 [Polyangiaceae bacterium]|nr:hypothetical protein [Polyangiaceae bacterium]
MIGTKLLFIAATALMGQVSEPSDGVVHDGSHVYAGRCAGTGCIQGTSLNGLSLNGATAGRCVGSGCLQGTSLNGISLNGATAGRCIGVGCVQGTSVNGLSPNGSAVQGTRVSRPTRVHEPKARAVGIILDQG